MRSYSHQSANEVWKKAANELLKNGQPQVESRNGPTLELLHAVLDIGDPRQRWIVARTPSMNPAFALAEVIWMMNGRSDTRLLAHWFPKYPEFVGGVEHQHAAYGKRLRSHFGMDQLRSAYNALKANPESRQVVLQIWSAEDDMPTADGQARAGDIPCNVMACILIRDGRLHWHQTLRSNDVDRGLPHNIVQFTFLQEIMAGWLGIDVGRYCHVAGSLHYYVKHSARMAIDNEVVASDNTDRLNQKIDDSFRHFGHLGDWMDRICQARQTSEKIDLSPSRLELPSSYMNMAWILAADDALRYQEESKVSEYIERCTNPIYLQLWKRWVQRKSNSGTTENSSP